MLVSDIPDKEKDFSRYKITEDLDPRKDPDSELNLIRVQQSSYRDFLQVGVSPQERVDQGLESVFREKFPIENTDGSIKLKYVSYKIEESNYTYDEAVSRDVTYSMPIKVKFRLEVTEGEREKPEIREEEIYLFDIPKMTERGTFIINGSERVIVNQIHKAPGVFFEEFEKQLTRKSGKITRDVSNIGKTLYEGNLTPYRGTRFNLEYDLRNELATRIYRGPNAKSPKIPVTLLIGALMDEEKDKNKIEEILRLFYNSKTINLRKTKRKEILDKILVETPKLPEKIKKKYLNEIVSQIHTIKVKQELEENELQEFDKIEKLLTEKKQSLTRAALENLKDIISESSLRPPLKAELQKASTDMEKRIYGIIGKANQVVDGQLYANWKKHGIKEVELVDPNRWKEDNTINDYTIHYTLDKDPKESRSGSRTYIFKKYNPGQPPTKPAIDKFFNDFFERCFLTEVGRYKLNKKFSIIKDREKIEEFLGEDFDPEKTTLQPSDIINFVKYIIGLNNDEEEYYVDDIDHLENRRVKTVGEQLLKQLKIGITRVSRRITDKMNRSDPEELTPNELLNPAAITAVINSFFGTGQLSQFMAQTNPLAELTHKRRTSALGPGGLTRRTAKGGVRDVHHTHYGRICPIETPEGANIGLITSLALYAKINDIGLIETPYRKVEDGKLTGKVEYLTADDEDKYVLAPANLDIDDEGNLPEGKIVARHKGIIKQYSREEIDYIDITPKQIVGASAGLIPFLEHDDANRALMGSNMQRQALPLMVTEPPIVATGVEETVAKNSGVIISARRAGEVVYVDGNLIVVWTGDKDKKKIDPDEIDTYKLKKHRQSNQETHYNQVPVVSKGDKVEQGDVLADGPATANGELALGRNLFVAFMAWEGYNFEDAVLISSRLVKEDVLTSIHIHEEEVQARELKLGNEEITRDIPNVGEHQLRDLDENGIIREGAYVKPKDILVGKVTPKGEKKYTPEVRLLKTIFGKKAEEVKDTSLKVPPGVEGKVIKVETFERKKSITKKRRRELTEAINKEFDEKIEELRSENRSITQKMLHKKRKGKITEDEYEDKKFKNKVLLESLIEDLEKERNRKLKNIDRGNELPVMVSKKVKVHIASRRPIMAGDKIAGRHGNKGIISMVLPEEDMPYDENGTPVDIVINPLSVPSRMNVGQILETHLGWAANKANIKTVNPVFDGAKESEIKEILAENNLAPEGTAKLYDGRTGEVLGDNITIGYMYTMKLEHMAEDKMHARATGPYSLITRQPLGGKALFGGQRFGEMEVWALEGYGAAYLLQEFLTYKSDDVEGRNKLHESILKGEEIDEPGVPESFKVLVKELQGLGFKVLLENKKEPR
ncbi:MAG: DNA-directed RNA polymerase subunit beta [Elusimicrobiota bacterium]